MPRMKEINLLTDAQTSTEPRYQRNWISQSRARSPITEGEFETVLAVLKNAAIEREMSHEMAST